MQSKRILILVITGALLVAVAISFANFRSVRETPLEDLRGRSRVAVVLTGDDERINAGLGLLADGIVDRVLISGAPNLLMWISMMETKFGLRYPNLQRMIECCVEFGERAQTTFQNGLETACWLERRGISGPLIVVTSAAHMRRALTDLESFVPNHVLWPYPVTDSGTASDWDSFTMNVREYAKYVATLIVLRMPPGIPPLEMLYGPWREGCPTEK
ncbi:MAG: hypothetical protein JWM36_1002 [Hyphomicrobiales bacterium]|nr:hypothetical protein [Hyphomicrobiales bacterium]